MCVIGKITEVTEKALIRAQVPSKQLSPWSSPQSKYCKDPNQIAVFDLIELLVRDVCIHFMVPLMIMASWSIASDQFP